jgi:hypothetical protein
VTFWEAVDVAEEDVVKLVVLTGGADEEEELEEEDEVELDEVEVLFEERIAKPPTAAMIKITTITTTIAMVLIAR